LTSLELRFVLSQLNAHPVAAQSSTRVDGLDDAVAASLLMAFRTSANVLARAWDPTRPAALATSARTHSGGRSIRAPPRPPTCPMLPSPSRRPRRSSSPGGHGLPPFAGQCVLRVKARGHRDLVTVIGLAAAISAGESITASGEWNNVIASTASSSRRGFSRPRRRVQLMDREISGLRHDPGHVEQESRSYLTTERGGTPNKLDAQRFVAPPIL
jgi:hypothetical protein